MDYSTKTDASNDGCFEPWMITTRTQRLRCERAGGTASLCQVISTKFRLQLLAQPTSFCHGTTAKWQSFRDQSHFYNFCHYDYSTSISGHSKKMLCIKVYNALTCYQYHKLSIFDFLVSHPPHQILTTPLHTGLPGSPSVRKRDTLCGRYGVADIVVSHLEHTLDVAPLAHL